MEQLCTTCPLRKICGGPYDQTVDYIRANPQDLEDARHVLSLPDGLAVLGALGLGRPERCAELREHLSDIPHSTAHMRPFGECPEVWLAGKLVEEYTSKTE